METIGFVGAGNMAEAILQGVIAAGIFAPEAVLISDVRAERLTELAQQYGVQPVDDNPSLAAKADILVLSVKPKTIRDALSSMRGHLRNDTLVVSIVAGTRIADIVAILGDVPIIRVMPNTPALINEGASALYPNDRARPLLTKIRNIFACVGEAVVVDEESLIDAVTAVSGSGPAYYFLMMEKMIEAAVSLGLPEETAKTLVIQTARGAALLASQAAGDNQTPGDLARKVATPGGTTEAALNALGEGGFGGLVEGAIRKAHLRTQTLSA